MAVVGIGCRFPGNADNPDRFWALLRDAVDAIGTVPRDRYDVDAYFDPDPARPGKMYTKWGGFIDAIDAFDADFFGISPREAARLDPQQRLLLEVAWEALEDGGLDARALAGSRAGVFVGICSHDYGHIFSHPGTHHLIDSHVTSGSSSSVAANRISFFFDFKGPSLAVDTACSSSLTAVHLACRSLAAGECDLALAGGVNVLLTPEPTIAIAKAGMLSPDGRCKAFDASANGYVRGEGAGIVVLKPVARAIEDGDRIYAVIRGTAINQDGRTSSITVPSRDAQELMLREALVEADVEPSAIQYVEAHGTGTPVGDPIEVSAIGAVISTNRRPETPCLIGSVKTNIGHLEAASGVAGLIKTSLALYHREIPQSLHFRQANPAIPFDDFHLRVTTTHQPWPAGDRSLASVNSFGFGGSNAHAILEGPPAASPRAKAGGREHHVLAISARSLPALRLLAGRYRDLIEHARPSLADLCYSASVRRAHLEHRLAIVANSHEALIDHLDHFVGGGAHPDMAAGRAPNEQPRLAFVFPGMGPQWWGMGRQLFEEEPIFRDVLHECDRLLRPLSGWSLVNELRRGEDESRVGQPELAQVTNLAIQVGLSRLWRSWGIEPDAVVGHSAGEVAAAHVAGALPLSDALKVAFHRGRLQARTAGTGRMLAVGLPLDAVKHVIRPVEERVAIAAVNSPASVTLSGASDALEQLAASFEQQQIFSRFLQVTVPYHGPQMDCIRDELLNSLRELDPATPAIPLLSATLGGWSNGQPFDAAYWWQNIRQPVRFATAIDRLVEEGYQSFVEVGPHPVLAASIAECAAARGTQVFVCPSIRRMEDERPVMLRSLAALHVRGRRVRWPGFYPTGNVVPLPTYPWQRERHWFETEPGEVTRNHAVAGTDTGHPLLGRRLRSVQPSWETDLGDPRLSYLEDHLVQGSIVYPGAAYIETALAAAVHVGMDGATSVERVAFIRPLSLDRREDTILQLVYDADARSFAIHSAVKGAQPSWTRNATATLGHAAAASGSSVDLAAVKQRCGREVSVADAYAALEGLGLQYRGVFRGITELWQGPDEALGRVGVVEHADSVSDVYVVHPALLDSALQVMVAATSGGAPAAPARGLYLPVSIDRVRLHARPGGHFWSHVTIRHREPTAFEGSIELLDDDGRVAVAIDGLRCKLVETTRPARLDEMDDWLYQLQWEPKPLPPVSSGIHLRPPLEIVDTFRSMASSLAERWRENKYDLAVERRLNTIVSRFIVAAFAKLGWDARRHGSMDAVAIAESLGVVPAQRRFFSRLLDIASAEQAFALLASGAPVEPLRHCEELLADYPEGSAFIEMMSRCGNHLAEILRGERDVRELLFSTEALTAWEKFFAIPWYTFYNTIVADAVAAAIEGGAPATEVRILEIGAGTGGTTSFVLPRLSTTPAEYWFTDISPFFLTQARQRFAGQSQLRFHTLDIEAEPIEQGFEPHAFHVILAANVFHATADLRHTLNHVRRLLAPGGLLVLLEGTRPVPFIDLIFGVTEGWWRFADSHLRTSHPLLDREGWRSLLHEAGFEDACTFAVDTESLPSVQTVILSRAPLAADAGHGSGAAARRWVVFADGGGVGQAVAEALRDDGDETQLVFASDAYRQRDDRTIDVTSANGEDMTRLLDALHAKDAGIDGLLHFWSLDAPRSEHLTTAALMDSQRRSCDSVLTLLQAFEGSGRAIPDLWLITAGSQPIDDESEPLNVSQAPLWGFGRVLLNEQPHVRSRLVDLGPACTREEIAALLQELRGNDFEEEVAFREDRRLVRRLRRTSLARGLKAEAKQRLSVERDTFRLEIASPGSLETLALHSIPDLRLNADEIAIRVFAASPNFRDVMLAFGMLPAVAFRGETDKPLLGIECSGVVVECGDEVEEFRPGDEVIAIATGAFGSRTRTRYHLAARKPPHLTFEEAATVPAGFVTAHYAFHHLARLAPGERVLIHSATGGVGLAAIQLARRMGAVIFGTAGNPQKRAYLASMGIEHVMDSRSLTFAEEILDRTNGEGVDVVLNSLTGEAIPKGLSILRSYGRFVEIGKRDIYENSQVGLLAFNKNLSFFSVALDRICFERSRFAGEMLREMVRQVSDRVLDPLPHTDFDLAEAEQAFRFFAQAKHIGKVVLSFREEFYDASPRADEAVIRADATYLITGGLGGFGLAVADWLVRQGARHVVLMSRSGTPIPENERAAHALREGSAHVEIAKGDVSSERDVARVLDDIRKTMPPLKGVFHLAGVLDDGPLAQLDRDRLHAVLAPKIAGGWNLHMLTQRDDLDMFVLFSSSASVFGNSAQANYAAANAFLDSLAPHRRALGLPALTINWGWLSGTGYISRHGALDKHLARQGLSDFSPEEALALLEQLLRRQFVQVAALRQDWHKWSALDQSLAVVKKSRRLTYFDMSNGASPDVQVSQESSPVMQRLLGAASHTRQEILEEYMVARVAKVLGGSPDRIDPERPLAEMGFDSLMAVELQVMLGMDLKVQIAVVKLLQGISIRQLAASLLDQLPLATPASGQTATPAPPEQDRTIAPTRAVDDESPAPVREVPSAVIESIAASPEQRAERPDEIAVPGNGVPRTRSVEYYRSLDYARWSPFQRLARKSLGALVRMLARVDVEGLQHVPTTGAFLLASNHLSMIDGPVMWPFVPRRTVIFAGERWARVPLVNWAFDFVNTIYIRRGSGDRAALEAGLAVLQSGGALGLAPEGTVSASGGLMEGRTGLVYLAHEAGVPIVPLVMYGQEQMGVNLRRLKRTHIHIRVGPPISLTGAAAPTGVKLREDTRYVMSTLAGMLPPSYQGVYAADVQAV